uniref:UDENN domain-containing protein n=1 Tax=Macrostomum lignano TaxID=282301 RepID=A0A1I8IL24_9PLAT
SRAVAMETHGAAKWMIGGGGSPSSYPDSTPDGSAISPTSPTSADVASSPPQQQQQQQQQQQHLLVSASPREAKAAITNLAYQCPLSSVAAAATGTSSSSAASTPAPCRGDKIGICLIINSLGRPSSDERFYKFFFTHNAFFDALIVGLCDDVVQTLSMDPQVTRIDPLETVLKALRSVQQKISQLFHCPLLHNPAWLSVRRQPSLNRIFASSDVMLSDDNLPDEIHYQHPDRLAANQPHQNHHQCSASSSSSSDSTSDLDHSPPNSDYSATALAAAAAVANLQTAATITTTSSSIPFAALQGTTDRSILDSPGGLKEQLRFFLDHDVCDEPISESVLVIADCDRFTVTVKSLSADSTVVRDLGAVVPAYSVHSMLEDSCRHLDLGAPPAACLAHIESCLQRIERLGRALAAVLRCCPPMDRDQLAACLHTHPNDLPLLASIALSQCRYVTPL